MRRGASFVNFILVVVAALAAASTTMSCASPLAKTSLPPEEATFAPPPTEVTKDLSTEGRKLGWECPSAAMVRETFQVTATISAAGDVEIADPRHEAPVRVTPVMRLDLQSVRPGAFDIHERQEAEAPIERSNPTRWIWDVTPKETGDFALALSVKMVVEGRGTTRSKLLTSLTHDLRVNIRPLDRARETGSALWAQLLALAAGLAVLYKGWTALQGFLRKKEEKDNKPSDED